MVSVISAVFLLATFSIHITSLIDGWKTPNNTTAAKNKTYKNRSDDLMNTSSHYDSSSHSPDLLNTTDKDSKGAGSAGVFSIIRQDSISQETYESFDYALDIVVLPVVVVLGFCGNVAALRTLQNQKPRDPIIIYLIWLTIADILHMIFQCLIWVKDVILLYNRRLGLEMYAFMFVPIGLVLRLTTVRASAFITVLLSVERTVAVMFPFKVKVIVLNQHPRKVLVALYAITLLIFLPNVLRFDTHVLTNDETNQTIIVVLPTKISKSTMFFTYYGLAAQIVTRILPMILVLTCNIVTMTGLRASQRNRKHLGINDREDLTLTRMLLSISAIFLVCTAPGTISGILTKFIVDYRFQQKEHFLYSFANSISDFLDMVNSAVNFIAYIFLSKRFRETFFQTWQCADRLRNLTRCYGNDNTIESNPPPAPKAAEEIPISTVFQPHTRPAFVGT